ncbi:hypothetical protein LTR53_006635 [Teratosphaeriaceae sp. CCFEE 6253]|nr:hypothetical protein LTR53_006635 [Teratosphaeriaceae sp. CCFEE 6253]
MLLPARFFKPQLIQRVAYTVLAFAFAYLVYIDLGPAVGYKVFAHPHPVPLAEVDPKLNDNATAPSVDLVIASVGNDDITWASHLPFPNYDIRRYISDDPSAKYHPPKPKGREALMYFTYLCDFYDSLPEVSIFVHAAEMAWHVEGTLLQNTSFALANLDLRAVQLRGYFNLRMTWRAGCPVWIDTRKSLDDYDKEEEPYMAKAWRAYFGEDAVVPPTLGGPCCTQLAVAREAIRRRPRAQYCRSRDWLLATEMRDAVVGRVWEHMWPNLFTNETSDCAHPERESLCQMYGICFADDPGLDEYKELWEERERLKEAMSFFRAVWRPREAAAAREKLIRVNGDIEQRQGAAWRSRHGFRDGV